MLARASSGWLLGQLAPALLPALRWRLFATTNVVVPPMGDSITEGSISAVLKQAGDAVAENEVIAQIETDKVVIDVKAPEAGVLESVLVKPDDVVNPGAPVAVINPGAAPEASPSSRPAASEASGGGAAPPPPSAAPPAAASAPAPSAPSTAARRPGIAFPLRMTADGTRISTLPASEAAAYLRQHAAAGAPPAAPAAAAPPPPGASSGAQQLAVKPKAVPSKAPPPPRRQLSEREMEIIELGGALP